MKAEKIGVNEAIKRGLGWGGISRAAKLLRVSRQSIYLWDQKGSVPEKYAEKLSEIFTDEKYKNLILDFSRERVKNNHLKIKANARIHTFKEVNLQESCQPEVNLFEPVAEAFLLPVAQVINNDNLNETEEVFPSSTLLKEESQVFPASEPVLNVTRKKW